MITVTKDDLRKVMMKINKIEHDIVPSDNADDYTTKSISIKKFCAKNEKIKDELKELFWMVKTLY